MRAHEATLIGTDNMGNKYYERMENTQFGMHLVLFSDSQKLLHIGYNYPSEYLCTVQSPGLNQDSM